MIKRAMRMVVSHCHGMQGRCGKPQSKVQLTETRVICAPTIVSRPCSMGRDSVRGDEAVKACQKARGGAGAHEFVHVDAALLSNIRAAAATFSATHDRLDALVLTQSIASMDGRTETAEGIDKKLALHYFGRFEFTEALLPLLRRGPAPRVMSVLSAGVHSVYPNAVDDFELRTHYSLKNAADAAGLYNDAGLDGLAHEATNSRVAFIHAAPGFVNTAWGTDLPWYARYAVRMLQPLGRSAADCAEYLVGPILRPDTATGAVVLIGQDGQTVKAAHTAVHAPLLQMTREVNARALASAAAKASAATPAASAASK